VLKVSYTWFDSQPTFITALLANDVTIYLMNKACHLALSKKKNKLGAQVASFLFFNPFFEGFSQIRP
jgi:hypothetical protein